VAGSDRETTSCQSADATRSAGIDRVPPWNVEGATILLRGKERRECATVVSILANAFVYVMALQINAKLHVLSQVEAVRN
jgi:hypothetical protein